MRHCTGQWKLCESNYDYNHMSDPTTLHDQSPADTGSTAQKTFRWGPGMTIAWLVAIGILTTVLVIGLGVAIVFIEFAVGDGRPGDTGVEAMTLVFQRSMENNLGVLTAAQALILIGLVLLVTRSRGTLTRTGMLALQRISAGYLVKWTLVAIGAVFILSEVPQIFIDIGQETALEWLGILQPVWLGMFILVVLAPLSEELLFRGFVYGGLAPSPIGPIGAIIVTSLVWTVIHVQYDWLVMTQIFIYGVVFGVVRWQSGSLWPSVAAHAVINLLAGLIYYGGYGGA